MSGSPFKWRTAIEYAIISVVIYFLVGAPGFPKHLLTDTNSSTTTAARSTAVSHVKLDNLVYPAKDLQCPDHKYNIRIFSASPLIIYIENFVSEDEAAHLVQLSENSWQPSTIFNAGHETSDTSIRKSDKAKIPRDKTVQCIEQRGLAIQGYPASTFVERLWTQRYGTGGHYANHYDWATASKESRRVSTFMVYLAANCTGGGTNFPRIRLPSSAGGGEGGWCEFVECGESDVEGVTFRPVAGNAVFWLNFDPEGRGYKETIHAGMPVLSGTKIGLNLWSWYQAGYSAADLAKDEL